MGIDPISLGIASTVVGGAFSVAQGFAQAGVQRQLAQQRSLAAQETYGLQTNAIMRNEQQQAEAETAQTSTRVAQGQRNIGTLLAVMGERGVSGATFTGLLNDLSNSEGVDVSRINEGYQNQVLSDTSRIQAAGQDLVNTQRDAAFQAKAATSSAWLNTIGTAIKIPAEVASQEMRIGAYQNMEQIRSKVLRGSGYYEPVYQ